jgi:hypothetical protein
LPAAPLLVCAAAKATPLWCGRSIQSLYPIWEFVVDSTKKFLTLGFVFLACGVTFLTVAFTTHLSPLYAVGFVQVVLGIVFMVLVKTRARRVAGGADT